MEDIKTIVIDCGSSSTKVGFGGETDPGAVFPTAVTHTGREWHAGEDLSGVPEFPVADGVVMSWDGIEHIWEHTFRNALHADPKEHAVFLTESVCDSQQQQQQRSRSAEVLFEKFGVAGLGSETAPVLSLYLNGLTDGVIVDCGDGRFTATPVFSGNVIRHAITRSALTGRLLTERMAELVPDLQGNHTAAKTVKEKLCYVSANMEEDTLVSAYGGDKASYTLPGGRVITLCSERFRCPEVLFRPELLNSTGNTTANVRATDSVQAIVHAAISKCIPDIQCDLYKHIVPIGGTAMLQGFDERLKKELLALAAPGAEEVRVVLGCDTDRACTAWAGASLMTLNPAARAGWITREEYAEYGYEQWSRRAIRPGEVEPIVTRMRNSEEDMETQNFGCEALGYTALFTPRFAMSVAAQGGVDTILAAMKKKKSKSGDSDGDDKSDLILQESGCLALSFVLGQDDMKERFCSQFVLDTVADCAKRFPESTYISQSIMALKREEDPRVTEAVQKGMCTSAMKGLKKCPYVDEGRCPFAAGHYYCPGCCAPQKMFFCSTCAKEEGGNRTQLFCKTCWKHHTKNHEGVEMFVPARCHCEEEQCKVEKSQRKHEECNQMADKKENASGVVTLDALKALSETQVVEWLESVGIKSEKAAKAIVDEEISGEALALMTKEDLVASGIPTGVAVRIMAQLQKL